MITSHVDLRAFAFLLMIRTFCNYHSHIVENFAFWQGEGSGIANGLRQATATLLRGKERTKSQ